jgi:hypothetical protein
LTKSMFAAVLRSVIVSFVQHGCHRTFSDSLHPARPASQCVFAPSAIRAKAPHLLGAGILLQTNCVSPV